MSFDETSPNSMIEVRADHYPENGKRAVKNFYKEKFGAQSQILDKKLFSVTEECDMLSYTLLLPLWFIVYLFL